MTTLSSTNSVNFSLRQNKTIERTLVFEHLARALAEMAVTAPVYAGLGSVWFTDFQLAAKLLGARPLLSVESDELTFRRARFNRPYADVEVHQGDSAEVLPALLRRSSLRDRPWIVWLDFDFALDEERIAELRLLVHTLPSRSTLLTTFSSTGRGYGSKASTRPERLRRLFGDAVDPKVSADMCKHPHLSHVLARATLAVMESAAISGGRPGGFVPAFSIAYRDGAPMVTVGGFLPGAGMATAVRALVNGADWEGLVAGEISIPPLTNREIEALQRCLPASRPLRRSDILRLGFDLEQEHIDAFARHYKRYPSFAQVTR